MAHGYELVDERGGVKLERTNSQSGYKYVSANGLKWRVDYQKNKSVECFEDPADAAVLVARYLEAIKVGGDKYKTMKIDTVVAAYLGDSGEREAAEGADLSTPGGILDAMSAF